MTFPLEGIRILDFSGYISSAACACQGYPCISRRCRGVAGNLLQGWVSTLRRSCAALARRPSK